MKNQKYGWLLIGLLMGMIIGALTLPAEAWGAEIALIVPSGQTVIDDITDPSDQEVKEAIHYLDGNQIDVPAEIEELCIRYGKENNICPELLEAIAWKESRFQADVTNASGNCHGLMQIHKGSHRSRMQELNVSDLYDPEQNIKVAAHYLQELFEQYEDVATVLEYYNGDGAAANDPNRTSSYAKKVMSIAQALERAHWK